jgi:tetratricopeptide (TPR) repeat protein
VTGASRNEEAHSRRPIVIILVTAIAFAIKLALALKTYGTNDVYSYERFAVWSCYFGANLYQIAPDFNHPPSMIHVLRFLRAMAELTKLPFHFWIRFPGILADAGSVWLICRILGSRVTEQRSVFIAVLLIAGSPMQILISGFHGNTDPLMIFFVLAAVYLTGSRDSALAGGIAYGLAICIKIVPIILIPVLFLALPTVRKRIMFFSAAGAVILVGWSPFIFQQPRQIVRQVLGYKSSYGLWGLSWIFRELADTWPALQGLNRTFRSAGTVLLVAAIIAVSVRMNQKSAKPRLYAQIGMIFLLFFALASGFAVQYLAWLAPWIACLGVLPVASFVFCGSVFLLVVYNYWALGMPWYLAIAYPWQQHQYFQILCWISVLILTYMAWRQIRNNQDKSIELVGKISPPLRFGVVIVAVVFVIYPAAAHMQRDRLGVAPAYGDDAVLNTQSDEYHNLAVELFRRGRASEADAAETQSQLLAARSLEIYNRLIREQPARLTMPTPEDFVYASLSDYENGAFAECIADAQASLRLRPGMPAAWNNISLCNGSLGNWDVAIAAAKEALHSEPDYTIAQQNLDWVTDQKRRAISSGK